MNEATTTAPTIRLMSWNMGAGGPNPMKATWADLTNQPNLDVALLQEAPNPHWVAGAPPTVPEAGSRWGIGANRARTAVARLSDRVEVTPFPTQPLGHDGSLEIGVSRVGTLTVAKVRVRDTGEEFLVASVYGQWEGPASGGPGIYADASMHRILSDLSPVLSWRDLPVIVAGDFNLVLGVDGGSYGGNWRDRDRTVFERFNALGLFLAGPQAPRGHQADPWPSELPADSYNVPTFVTSRGRRINQLDYCYVSADLVDRVTVTALNGPDDWGPSDHCRVTIDLEPARVRTWTEESFLAEVATVQHPEVRDVVVALFAWASDERLRVEFVTGPEGQWYAQYDGIEGELQYTFSVRTRGDLVIQFQWMRHPYDSIEARDALRQEINAALDLPFAEIGADQLSGRPTVALHLLADDQRRAAFLDVFTAMLARTRGTAALSPNMDPGSTPDARDRLRSQFRGCLLGGAIGDSLGAQVEFLVRQQITSRFGAEGPDRLGNVYGRSGGFTDDTQMTLFTAEGLLRADTRSRERGVCSTVGVVLHAYLRWLHTQGEPVPTVHGFDPDSFLDGWLIDQPAMQGRRAPGNSCISALKSGRTGTVDEPINNSKGCGAVMRMAPVGLFAHDPFTAFQVGVELGALTHGHPSGYLPAGVFAATICALVEGDTMRDAFDAAASMLRESPGHEETTSMLSEAMARAGDGPPSPQELERYGEGGWWGCDALAIAARVALACDDPADALRRAVNHGGDSDSTGSLVGNLIGAHLGADALPATWVAQLDGASVITTIADDLLTARLGEVPSTWTCEQRSPGHSEVTTTDDPLADEWWKRYPGW